MDPIITADEQRDGASSIMEHLRDTSRPYQNQAMALIGICRFFSQFLAQGQGQSEDTEPSQDAELTRSVSYFRMNSWPPFDEFFQGFKNLRSCTALCRALGPQIETPDERSLPVRN